ncbi:IS5 family transposase [Rubrobacter taiwanensis]|uniref:IS5 family transposase n=1 Tax=Rubrobacter taiwanensis TaxID=185139 RepID=UPI003C75CA0D
MPARYELTETQWRKIKDLLPGKPGDRGRTARDNRTFVNGVLWVLRSGAYWCHLPERYGNWKSVHKRFTRWARAGVWEGVFEVLTSDPDNEYLMIDTTIVRAHQQAASGKGGNQNEALGRSRGGLSTKIHMLCDALGRPLHFVLTGGQVNDSTQAERLLDGVETAHVIADRGYDSDGVLEKIEGLGAIAVIPPKSNRREQREYDKELYKERNLIERTFNKLKSFRRIATRYDRKALYFRSFLYLAASLLWM